MVRRTLPIPIPGPELRRMQDTLAPSYGSETWESDGHRILVVRTPSDDPDVVNDLERAIEHLLPGDVADLDHCLLVGNRHSTAVSVAPLQQLMRERLARDDQVATILRDQIRGRTGHVLLREPGRRLRLGIRIAKPRARDIDDDDLDVAAEDIGAKLATPHYSGIRAVHLIADEDDVRIDGDVLLPELLRRFEQGTHEVRREEADERGRRELEAKRRREREEIQALLRRRFQEQYRDDEPHPTNGRSWDGAGPAAGPARESTSQRHVHAPTSSTRTEAGASSDALRATSGRVDRDTLLQDLRSRGAGRTIPRDATPGPTRPSGSSSDARLAEVLRDLGYDVLERPHVPGHALDLAAERDEEPRRIIARTAGRLTIDVAEDMLRACRQLGTDVGLVVAPEADDEARELLVATRAKWIAPEAVSSLHL